MERSCRLLHGQPRQPFPLLTGRIVLSNKKRNLRKYATVILRHFPKKRYFANYTAIFIQFYQMMAQECYHLSDIFLLKRAAMNGQTWKNIRKIRIFQVYHIKSHSIWNRIIDSVLKVHNLCPFQQALNFGNRVRNVWVIQKFVRKVKKQKQFLSNKTNLEVLRNTKKDIFEFYSINWTTWTM